MKSEAKRFADERKWQTVIFIVTVLLTFALLTFQVSVRKSSYSLEVGDVAGQDILAPHTMTYVSVSLTEQARKDAELTVQSVYLPADPSISRNQLQYLRNTFTFAGTVRADSYSSPVQKMADMNQISYVRFDEATIDEILNLESADWEALQSESLRVLEQIMQSSIRDAQVMSEIENIPTMINYTVSKPIAALVNTITRRFVAPNSVYSEGLTAQKKNEARDSILPRERTFITNQTIVQRGQIITNLIYEALDEYELVTPHDLTQKIISAVCIIIGLAVLLLTFVKLNSINPPLKLSESLVISALFIVFLFSARMLIPNRAIVPYLFPLQAFGLTIACLFGKRLGMVLAIVIGFLVPYDFTDAGVYYAYFITTALTGIFILQNGRRISSFILAGVGSGLVGILIIAAFQFSTLLDWIGFFTLAGAAILNGILSIAIALIAQYLLSGVLGVTTSLQLMEILRPDSELMQYILAHAPGTYQHSLMVANLAEQAAKDIGADPLLVRAGAMYHDAGKAANPSFFVENQVVGHLNLHDDMSAKDSAAAIIAHVPDGAALIRRYRLPERLVDFVQEHHGTNITRYQLNQAIQASGEENIVITDFTYTGPRPRSKETALVMLADTTEARARADKPTTDEQIDSMIKNVFDYYSTSGQLDDTPLTLKDLTMIRASFGRVLRNTYHPRVVYPDTKKSTLIKKPDVDEPTIYAQAQERKPE